MRLLTAALLLATFAGPISSHALLTRHGGEIAVRLARGIQHPSLAALPGGGFVVVWSEPHSAEESTTAAVWRRAPLAPTPSAAFVLRSHQDVLAAWFDADGQLIRGPMVVNQTPTGETTLNWYAQVAAATDGAVLIAWRPWEAGTVLARFFDANGNATSDEVQLNPEPSRYYGEVAVTATAPDAFVVVWNELDDVLPYDRHFLMGRRVTVDGTLSDVFLVSPVEAPADQMLPSIVSVDGRHLLVTWFNEVGEQTIQARFLGDDPLRPAFDIAGGQDEHRPRVCVLPSGEFMFAWEGYQSAFEPPRIADDGAWFRRYSATREPLGDPLPVLRADPASPDVSRTQHVSGFVCPSSGIPMVVIDAKNVLIGPSLAGTVLTTEFEIARENGGGAGSLAGETDVISVSDAAFVVTWAQCVDAEEDAEPDCQLRAQIYSRQGESPCQGDCSLDGRVTIDELVVAIRIALAADGTEMRACLPATETSTIASTFPSSSAR